MGLGRLKRAVELETGRMRDRIRSKVSAGCVCLARIMADPPDFEKYIMLRTLSHTDIDTSGDKRLIFIGDVHGSFDPLEWVICHACLAAAYRMLTITGVL